MTKWHVAGETAWSAKHKQEYVPKSKAQKPHTNPDVVAHAAIPELGMEDRRVLRLNGQPACPSQKVPGQQRGIVKK